MRICVGMGAGFGGGVGFGTAVQGGDRPAAGGVGFGQEEGRAGRGG